MTREDHEKIYREALAKYEFTEKRTSEASLFYLLTFVAGENYEKFLDPDSRPGRVYINPDTLGVLSSAELCLVKLAFHLFTWRDEYAVPEVDFCCLEMDAFEAMVQALRIRCEMTDDDKVWREKMARFFESLRKEHKNE